MAGEKRTIAHVEGYGSVEICACGTVHLSMGPVSVALSQEAFAQTWALLVQARATLATEPAAHPLPGSAPSQLLH